MEKDIYVHIDQFDGPLALLLYLVQKEEMPIESLDLTEITGQYLNYLNKMKELNFDVAGEFLYMASALIFLKSERSVDEESKLQVADIDDEFSIQTKEQLIQKLKELEKYQNLGLALWELPKQNEDIFTRPKIDKKQHFQTLFKEMSLTELSGAMIDFIKKESRKFQVISKDKLSIKNKLIWLKGKLILGKKFLFGDLLEKSENKVQELVLTFISVLELARLKRVEVFQAEDSSEIYVDVVKDLENFDIDQADGFDEPQPEVATTLQ